jgi:hypothetical protein
MNIVIDTLRQLARQFEEAAQRLETSDAPPVSIPIVCPAPTAPAAPAPQSNPQRTAPRHRKGDTKPGCGNGKIDFGLLVRQAVAVLDEPFALDHVRAWFKKHHPEAVRKMGSSTISSAIGRMRTRGEVRDTEKIECNGRTVCGYKRAPHFGVAGALSDKERRYRELRDTMTPPATEEA